MLGLRYPLTLLTLVAFAATIDGCSNDGGERLPQNVINIGVDAGTFGCTQQGLPSDHPDLSPLTPPIFLLTNIRSQQSSTGQAQASPGETIEAEIWVNGATRRLIVELANAHSRDNVIYRTEEQTSGNQTVPVLLFSDETNRGRYYMRLTLCGFDCDERQVLFDLHSGVNAPYDRTVIEEGEIVRLDSTCIDVGSTPGVGSGTVLIQ